MRYTLTAILLATAAACTTPDTSTPDAAISSVALDQANVVSSGTFSGRNDHVVEGGVQIVEVAGQHFLRLDENFSLDGAPDPKIGFGTSGSYDTGSTFTVLGKTTGFQDYALPVGWELGNHNEAYIWCDEFSVALGIATLQH